MTQDTPSTDAGPVAQTSASAPGAGTDETGISIVSKNFSIVGDLNCHDILQIDGSVEGNITCEQLTVTEGGRIKGDIHADKVDMSGTFTGAIDARVLTLSKSSIVTGDIVVHETLGIEPGASFDGSCKKLGPAAGTSDDASAEEPASDEMAVAPEMEAAEPEAPTPEESAAEPDPADAADEIDMMAAPDADAEPAPADVVDEIDMMEAPEDEVEAIAEDAPADNLSSALNKVAAELPASMANTQTQNTGAEPEMEAPKAALEIVDSAPDADASAPLPGPSEPPENFADAMAKPEKTDVAPAPVPAKPTATPAAPAPVAAAAPAVSPEQPAKPAAASNGAA